VYERHFGFRKKPFSLTPDPEFLYLSSHHSTAMTMLEYGLESQAPFSLLTGEIGSGKTTLLRRLLRKLGDQVMVGLISNTHANFESIVPWAVNALDIAADDSSVAQYQGLCKTMIEGYARGRRTLLVIDEAQNLSVELLEELRLLSNVNSEGDLILQILLIGQPELRRKLASPELVQLAQRISVDYHLRALDRDEMRAYIRHRLEVASGNTARELFLSEAMEFIYARTAGIPRLVNQLCDLALLYAYADGCQVIDADLVAQVVRDRLQRVTTAPQTVTAATTSKGAA
jgi:general secretion pathway protein A